MEYDEQVVVGESPRPAPPRHGIRRSVVVPVLIIATGMACLAWWASRAPEQPESEPITLDAPSEPAPARPAPEPDAEMNDGWMALPLRDDGYVTSVTAGSGGWLAVSAGNGAAVHTSPDAVTWTSHPLAAGSAMVMAPTAVSGERLVVAGTDVVDSLGWSWVSDDATEGWHSTLISDQPVSLSSVTEVRGQVYAAGSILRRATGNAGVGTAAAWRLDGAVWEPLPLPQAANPDSRIVAIVDAERSPAAVGFDADGLAVWQLDDNRLMPVAVTGGDGARPTSVTRSPDGRYSTTGYATGSSLVSPDLTHWMPEVSASHWRVTNIDDEQVGAGFDYLAVVSDGVEVSRTAVSMGLISDISASEDGVIVAAGATNDDYTGVLWIRGISTAPTVETPNA